MDKKASISVAKSEDAIILRTAEMRDITKLRKWKNASREFFFQKNIIGTNQQQEWFDAYQDRPKDYMFIVVVNQIPVGCMGIRRIDEEWDVYNVILGMAKYGKIGIMSMALQSMIKFASTKESLPITLKVLKQNPAVSWYQKNGFVVDSDKGEYFRMIYQPTSILREV